MSMSPDIIRCARAEIDRRGWTCPCCQSGLLDVETREVPEQQALDLALIHRATRWREVAPLPAIRIFEGSDFAANASTTIDRSHPQVNVCVRIPYEALRRAVFEPVTFHVGQMLRSLTERFQPTQPTDNMSASNATRLFPRRNFLPAAAPNSSHALPRIRNINMMVSATGRTVYEFDVEVQQPYVELVRESTYKPGGLVTLNGVNCIIHEVFMDALEFGNVDFHCRAVPAVEAIAAGRGTPTHTHEPAKPMRAVDDLPVVHVPITPVTRRVIR